MGHLCGALHEVFRDERDDEAVMWRKRSNGFSERAHQHDPGRMGV